MPAARSSAEPTAPPTAGGVPARGGYGTLARRMQIWTSNLLATAIVLVGGLALGWQVLTWWGAGDAPAATALDEAASHPLIAANRTYWTDAGALRVEHVTGSRQDALAGMQRFCREEAPMLVSGEPGPGEKQFLDQLARQTPVETVSDLAIYQPPGDPPMVVAVSQPRGRIVAWSFALNSKTQWSLYHFRPASPGAVTTLPDGPVEIKR